MPTAGIATVFQEMLENYSQYADTDGTEIMMLPEYEALYEQNPDIIGWLRIEDTLTKNADNHIQNTISNKKG